MSQPINTARNNSIIEMFLEQKPMPHIANVLNCSLDTVSKTVTEYLGAKNRRTKRQTVEPFVLITNNEAVLEAYDKMLNNHGSDLLIAS